MKLKSYTLISTIVGSLATAAVAIVSYFNPEFCVAINSAIVIMTTAIDNAIHQFVKE